MPYLVDPSVVLPSFQDAMEAGNIDVRPCTIDKTLFHVFDIAEGSPRMTYVRLNTDKKVTVLVQFVEVEPYEGNRCFGAAWAVPLRFRGKGLASEATIAAIRELQNVFLSSQKGKSFCVEAIVGTKNGASLKTANKVFANNGTPGIDKNSGESIVQYVRLIDAAADLRLP